MALPLHVEYRTFPMLFYVPAAGLPVMSTKGDVVYERRWTILFGDIEKARAPIEVSGEACSARATKASRCVMR